MTAELPPGLRAVDWAGFADLVREVVRLEEHALSRKQRLLEETAHEVLRCRAEGVEPTEELLNEVAGRDVYLRKVLELEKRVVHIRRAALLDFLASERVHIRSPRDLQRWLRTAGPQAMFLETVTRVAADAAIRQVARLRRVTDEEAVIRIYQEVRLALDKSYEFLLDDSYEDLHLASLTNEFFEEFEGALIVFFEDQTLRRWYFLRLAQALLAVVLDESEVRFARALLRHRLEQGVHSVDEINWVLVAEAMGTTPNAVRMRWRRLKVRLGEILAVVVSEALRFVPQSEPEARQRLVQIIERLYGPGVLRRSRPKSSGGQRPQQPEPKPGSPPRLH